MRRLFLLPAVLLVFTVGSVCAQTVPTGSGSSSADAWQAERAARALNMRKQLVAGSKRDATRAREHADYLRMRTELRIACRADLRQANRDTKLPTLLRCYRSELSLEREELRREREYSALLAGVDDGIRKAFFTQVDALREAIQLIINGIDSDVYEDTVQVADARGKLQRVFRSKFFAARTLLRTDRALAWTSLLLSDLEAAGASGSTVHGMLQACLLSEEATLRAVQRGDAGTDVLPVALGTINACAGQAVQSGSGSSSS
ncbi:MAG: hypothetical protein WCV62_03885 [Candidatus Peribacteraceae bacterium]|jgi:hypothetical protein